MLPNRPIPLPILGGPFRGAVINLNPQHSLRKVFGVYEHELNGWLKKVLLKVNTVLDVGANDGYFTFGCATALRRLNRPAEIIAFEPESEAFEQLRSNLQRQPKDSVRILLNKTFVGGEEGEGVTTLNAFRQQGERQADFSNALIKLDVEGAEVDVIAGASSWLNATNYFLIEVHDESFLKTLANTFGDHGLKLRQIDQRPLPILGYENRSRQNWWLVSDIF